MLFGMNGVLDLRAWYEAANTFVRSKDYVCDPGSTPCDYGELDSRKQLSISDERNVVPLFEAPVLPRIE